MSTSPYTSSLRKERQLFFVSLAIIALFYVLPAPAPITPMGMRVIGVFLAVLLGWSLTNEVWPSLLGLLAFPLTGVITMPGLLVVGWGSPTVVFLIFAFGLIQYLEITGFSQHIANWLMSRSFLAGHPWRLAFMLLFMSFILDLFVKTIVGVLLAWELIYRITDAAGMKAKDSFPTLMMIGVTMIGSLSLVTMPWSMNAVVDFSIYERTMGMSVNIGKYLLLSVPFGLLAIVVYMALCRFVFRMDVAPLQKMDASFFAEVDLTMTLAKKRAAGALVAFVVLLLLPAILPKELFFSQVLQQISIVGAVAIIFLVLSLQDKIGAESFQLAGVLAKGIPWNIILMLAVILSIETVLMNPETGIKAFLNQTLGGFFEGYSFIMLIVVTLVVITLLTNIMMNMVVVTLLLPILAPLAPTLGMASEAMGYLIIVASSVALLTPASSAAASLLFPNTKWVTRKAIYSYGTLTVLVLALLLFVVFLAWYLIVL